MVIRFCMLLILYDSMMWLWFRLSFIVCLVELIVDWISVLYIMFCVFYGCVCVLFLFIMCVSRFWLRLF